MKRKLTNELKHHKTIKSTLLIPKKYYAEMSDDCSMNLLFSSLFEKYLPIIEKDLPIACNNVTTKYQDEGLDLQRVNFKPFPDEWATFKTLAIGNGVSMCLLFVYLLELEHREAEANSDTLNSLLTTHCMNAMLPHSKISGVPPIGRVECGLSYKKEPRLFKKFIDIQLK